MAKDILGNSWKSNGFIGSPEDADLAIRQIKLLRPRYLVGYTSGIAMIARRALERGIAFPLLTHAIPTSETVSTHDLKLVREGLGVSVIIEYGAVELGAIAGTKPGADGWPLATTWWANLVRTEDRSSSTITTLTKRVFPLIDYD